MDKEKGVYTMTGKKTNGYTILDKCRDTLFRATSKYDLSQWETETETALPVYGVYHIFCDKDWQKMAAQQIAHLKSSGLWDRTAKLCVSIIARNDGDISELRRIAGDDGKLEIVADCRDARKFEYPALQFIRRKCMEEDCLVYYFHTKGITYQNLTTRDRKFNNFKRNIEAWRMMMEYFLFDKWRVAVNLLSGDNPAAGDGPQRTPATGERFDVYGCYRFPPPPMDYYLYAGNFWWARALYVRTLPDFDESRMAGDRFFAEEWLFRGKPKSFSAFDTLADVYCVNMEPCLYRSDMKATLWARLKFTLRYNFVKLCRHGFGYDYKEVCQKRYQRLK